MMNVTTFGIATRGTDMHLPKSINLLSIFLFGIKKTKLSKTRACNRKQCIQMHIFDST